MRGFLILTSIVVTGAGLAACTKLVVDSQHASKGGAAKAGGGARPEASDNPFVASHRANLRHLPAAARAYPPPAKVSAAFRASAKAAEEHMKTCDALLSTGDTVGAEREAKLAVEVGPLSRDGEGFGPCLAKLGDVYLAQDKYEAALAAFTRARKGTGGEELEQNVSICELRLGRYDKSKVPHLMAYLRNTESPRYRAEIKEPANDRTLEAYLLWAKAMRLQLECANDRAIGCYAAAQKLLPDHPLLAFRHAGSLMALGRTDDALPQYEIADRFGGPELRKGAAGPLWRLKHRQR